MNYRHAYHAGNFADVLKHALLCWIVRYLQQKAAPLALIDTHAGAGGLRPDGTAGRQRPAKPRTASCACSPAPTSPQALDALSRPRPRARTRPRRSDALPGLAGPDDVARAAERPRRRRANFIRKMPLACARR